MKKKKQYWIKYKMIFGWNRFDWTFTSRYRTKKAMGNALADMVRKGHRVIETGVTN